jgi:hypothetical protein
MGGDVASIHVTSFRECAFWERGHLLPLGRHSRCQTTTGFLHNGDHDDFWEVWLPYYNEGGKEEEEERLTIPEVLLASIPEIPEQPQCEVAASPQTGNH